jgi:hypothetical protein
MRPNNRVSSETFPIHTSFGMDDHAILAECERDEQMAKR